MQGNFKLLPNLNIQNYRTAYELQMPQALANFKPGFPISFFKSPPLGSLKRQSPPKTFFHLQLENI